MTTLSGPPDSVRPLSERGPIDRSFAEIDHDDMQPLCGSIGTQRWHFDPTDLAAVQEHYWNRLGRRVWIEPSPVTLMTPPLVCEICSFHPYDIVKALMVKQKLFLRNSRITTYPFNMC